MMLEMIASNDDIRRQKHPDNGNLVFLELCYRNNEEKLMFLKIFAYVTYVHRSTITPHTFFNRELSKCRSLLIEQNKKKKKKQSI